MNSKKIIITVAAAVVALGLLIAGIFFVIKGINNDKSPEGSGITDSSSEQVSSGNSGSESDSSGSSSADLNSSDEMISAGSIKAPSVNAEQGKTVSVPIKLNENPGIVAGKLVFEYDSEAFSYNGCDNGDILEDCEDNASDGKISIIVIGDEIKDTAANGTLVTLNFTIKDNAAKGNYEIKVSDETMLCNAEEKIVVPEISNGIITVK